MPDDTCSKYNESIRNNKDLQPPLKICCNYCYNCMEKVACYSYYICEFGTCFIGNCIYDIIKKSMGV